MSLERIACTAMCPNVAPSSTTLKRTSLSPVLRRSQPSSRSSLGDFDPILAKRAKKLRGRARPVLQSRRYLVIISAAVQPRRPVALKRPSPLVATGRVVSADSSRRGDTLTRRFRVYSGLRRSHIPVLRLSEAWTVLQRPLHKHSTFTRQEQTAAECLLEHHPRGSRRMIWRSRAT